MCANMNCEKYFFSELKKECKVTLKQIEEKEYVFVFKNAGIEDILKIGVAFLGKDVEIESERRIGKCER